MATSVAVVVDFDDPLFSHAGFARSRSSAVSVLMVSGFFAAGVVHVVDVGSWSNAATTGPV